MSEESRLSAIQRYTRVFNDTYTNLPTANVRQGELGYATDRRVLYRWTGAAWSDLTIYSDSGAIATIPAAANYPEGSLFYATDTLELWQVQAATWMKIVSDVIYSGADVIGDIPAAGTVAEGSFFYATDTKDFYQVQAGAWVSILTGDYPFRFLASEAIAGETNKTISFAAHDLIKILFSVDQSGAALLTMQLNGITGATYNYRYIDDVSIVKAAAQTTIILFENAVSYVSIAELLITGREDGGMKHLSMKGSMSDYDDKMLLNAHLSNDANDLTSVNIRISAGTITGTIEAYGKNF